tara:strand:+ start:335 stop:514 length:180 start_codon:yes stop_codon:yes gene_type:complete
MKIEDELEAWSQNTGDQELRLILRSAEKTIRDLRWDNESAHRQIRILKDRLKAQASTLT